MSGSRRRPGWSTDLADWQVLERLFKLNPSGAREQEWLPSLAACAPYQRRITARAASTAQR
jgi:hypothetical protein